MNAIIENPPIIFDLFEESIFITRIQEIAIVIGVVAFAVSRMTFLNKHKVKRLAKSVLNTILIGCIFYAIFLLCSDPESADYGLTLWGKEIHPSHLGVHSVMLFAVCDFLYDYFTKNK